MRASRLLSLLMLLRAGGDWTASALAGELEVSVRTVYRDIAELQGAGVPLWTESGPGGGIRLLPGWRNDLDGLTGDEVAALSLAGVPTALGDLGLGAVALSARLKVRSTLPPELRSRAARVEERFLLDAPGWFHRDDDTAHLGLIADAVWAGRRIDVTYGRPAPTGTAVRTVRRRLDPLGLVLKAGTWYLVARHRGATRTYRVGRIRSCRVLPDTFERPDGFDLSAWWARSSAEFDRSLLRERCEVALGPVGRRRLHEVTDPGAAQRALATARPLPDAHALPDGWVVVDLECESIEVAADQLVALAGQVQARRPEELRHRLRELAEATVALHAPG